MNWTGKIEIRTRTKYLTVGETCVAIYIQTLKNRERIGGK